MHFHWGSWINRNVNAAKLVSSFSKILLYSFLDKLFRTNVYTVVSFSFYSETVRLQFDRLTWECSVYRNTWNFAHVKLVSGWIFLFFLFYFRVFECSRILRAVQLSNVKIRTREMCISISFTWIAARLKNIS